MLDLSAARLGRQGAIAHRGASGEAPENTMASFRLAVEQGADLIELDVQVTSDGAPVVIHDPLVDRTTDGSGLVQQLTLAQVKALDAGAKSGGRYEGERVPTLDQVLEWASGVTPVAIEIKSGPVRNEGVESLVVEAVRRYGMSDSVVIIAFDHLIALKVREIAPEIACGVLFAGRPVHPSSLAEAARAGALLPHWADMDREMVEEAHSRGLAVCPWAIDGEREMAWALGLGVDAVATNYPARLAAVIRGTVG